MVDMKLDEALAVWAMLGRLEKDLMPSDALYARDCAFEIISEQSQAAVDRLVAGRKQEG